MTQPRVNVEGLRDFSQQLRREVPQVLKELNREQRGAAKKIVQRSSQAFDRLRSQGRGRTTRGRPSDIGRGRVRRSIRSSVSARGISLLFAGKTEGVAYGWLFGSAPGRLDSRGRRKGGRFPARLPRGTRDNPNAYFLYPQAINAQDDLERDTRANIDSALRRLARERPGFDATIPTTRRR